MTPLWHDTNSAYKSRVVPAHGIGRTEVQDHSFLILTQDGGEQSAKQSSRCTLKDLAPQVPTEWPVNWAAKLVWIFWTEKNILSLLEFEPWIVEPVT
jgi:hypothetical protein